VAARHGSGGEVQSRDELWEGAIWLPSAEPGTSRKYFYARLGGETCISPFSLESDTLDLHPSIHPITQILIDSKLRGIEWRVRPHVNHARSKTFTE
jgi:hypothetical protein